ncbi:hypothetical protein R1flu_014139 [Riccia fluitans]|uniref:Uncharacterized protein n=1 Tax=Riccia fluitans TaxID=41844 RepID=A0ABD1YFL3_9MARC
MFRSNRPEVDHGRFQERMVALGARFARVAEVLYDVMYHVDAQSKAKVKPLTMYIFDRMGSRFSNGHYVPKLCSQLTSELIRSSRSFNPSPLWTQMIFHQFCTQTQKILRSASPEVLQAIVSYLHDVGSSIKIPRVKSNGEKHDHGSHFRYLLRTVLAAKQNQVYGGLGQKWDIRRTYRPQWDNVYLEERRYLGYGLECKNATKTALTSAFFPRQKLIKNLGVTKSCINCYLGVMKISHKGYEKFLESDEITGNFVDVLVLVGGPNAGEAHGQDGSSFLTGAGSSSLQVDGGHLTEEVKFLADKIDRAVHDLKSHIDISFSLLDEHLRNFRLAFQEFSLKDSDVTDKIKSFVLQGKAVCLHFVCDARNGPHVVADQPGLSLVGTKEKMGWIPYISKISLRYIPGMLNAGIAVTTVAFEV